MLKRLSSSLKRDKDRSNGGTNGKSPETPTTNGTSTKIDRRRSSFGITKKMNTTETEPQPDHSVSKDGITATLQKYASVIHAAGRPLQTDTGDGSYIETPAKGSILSDLKSLKVKDFETLEELLRQTLSGEKLTDDKTMIMEKIIQLVSSLPSNSSNRVTLTNAFITELWDSLEHPPSNLLGDLYNYRQPDGSYNNTHVPELGKAGMPYARSVIPKTMLPGALPDPGVIFDSVMDRGVNFKPHPNRVSSMLYYIATIIIHDCFRTSHDDFNISTTSSYLDLSPLYGCSKEDVDGMRTFKDGQLKPDCFAEKRLLGFPPGVGCILIMFNRFHNYCATQLAAINENGRFSKPRPGLAPEKEEAAWKKRDEDLFQVARLITGGLYINVILLDYLRTIVNLNRVSTTWTLDPRAEMDKNKGSPRGTGNQVSCEFNLIYRWHSCISDRDDKWSQELYHKLFGKDYKDVTIPELLAKLSALEASIPDDPIKRDFEGLKRDENGKLSDNDLSKILIESIEDVAGASGARNVPQVMRAVEILGMKQARAWNCATLNEFRNAFGLKSHEKFEDINSDPYVADQLRRLYDHPDLVELYPGLVAEEAKEPMVPGVGIAPTYTISRTILSDAVTLVRGDRFLTSAYHPRNLTNWGFHEAQYDLNVNQGCVFHKLFLRAFPENFAFNSIYIHYPLTVPDENRKIMENLGRLDEFSWERPTPLAPRINVTSFEGVSAVLKDDENFKVTMWGEGLRFMMGKPGGDFMLAGDGPFFRERREQMGKCLYHEGWEGKIKAFYEDITLELLQRWSYKLAGTNQVDIIRDVGNSAHTYFAAAVFHLPLKTEENKHGIYTEHELYGVLAIIFIVIFFGAVDPATTFQLRTAGLPLCEQLGQLIETNVGLISKTGFISGLADKIMEDPTALKDYGVHMVRSLLKSGLSAHEVAWSQVLPTAAAMVPNQAQVFGQIIDYYLSDEGKIHLPEINRLAKLNTPEADHQLLHYVMEGVRLNGTFGAYRTAAKDITVMDNGKPLHFKAGHNAFAGFVDIARDPKIYPDPHKVRLDRDLDSYIVYGIGPHTCLGGAASRVALTAMLKVVGRLDNLRRAAGPPGQMKTIPREGGYYSYMDSFESTYFPFPTTMKISWDGDIGGPRKR